MCCFANKYIIIELCDFCLIISFMTDAKFTTTLMTNQLAIRLMQSFHF